MKEKLKKLDKNIKIYNVEFMRMNIDELINIIKLIDEKELSNKIKQELVTSLEILKESNRLYCKGKITSGATLSRESLELILAAIYKTKNSNKSKKFGEYKKDIIENQEKYFGESIFKEVKYRNNISTDLQEMYSYFSKLAHPEDFKYMILKIQEDYELAKLVGGYYINGNIGILCLIETFLINNQLLLDKNIEFVFSITNYLIFSMLIYTLKIVRNKKYKEIIISEYNKSEMLFNFSARLYANVENAKEEFEIYKSDFSLDEINQKIIEDVFKEHKLRNKDVLLRELNILNEEGVINPFWNRELKKFIKKTKEIK